MEDAFNPLDPFHSVDLDLAGSADGFNGWAISNRAPIQPIRDIFDGMISRIEAALHPLLPLVMLLLMTLIARQAAGRRTAILVGAGLLELGFLAPDAWLLAMTMLAIVTSAVIVCAIIGLPLGVLARKIGRFEAAIRPVLDTMRSILAFVYLVPVVMMVGIGNVSGVLVTIIFALPPLVRLGSLG